MKQFVRSDRLAQTIGTKPDIMGTNGRKTIDEVIDELNAIINEAVRDRNFIGIFTYVYWLTTRQIKANIDQGNFEDNERMHRMDVIFANFFLDAYRNNAVNKPVSKAWKVAFEAGHEQLTFTQQLLLGMNAHINLDLAIAASQVMKDKPITDLEKDFNAVNDILAGLLNRMQIKLAKVSPLMFLLDWLGKRTDEKIINFSMVQARTQSWRIANELWALEGDELKTRIDEVDQSITRLAEFIKSPKSGFLKFIVKVIRWFEVRDVAKVLKILRDDSELLILNPDEI